ncbi:MAG: radical SAM protein [Elusimicrobia bacterium]|nr:radical SAM protein [Elusimicrobiota bacterium]
MIALINPPIPGKSASLVIPSLGLGYLAASLRQAGLGTQIIDAVALGLDHDAVAQEVARLRPELVGITATTPLSGAAYRLAKSLRPHARWLALGGAHPSAVSRKIFEQCPELDFGFRGEAEESFPRFAKALLAGDTGTGFPGVITKSHDSAPASIKDPDQLPFPAWDLMPMERYRHPLFPGERLATIFSSRGCPYQCIFCDKTVCGSKYRPRSPENVIKEIEALHSKHDVTAFMFYDDLFSLDRERVIRLCRLIIDSGLKIRWKCECRANTVDDELLSWMKKAGCVQIAFGIETAHQKGLDWLRKGIKVEQVKDAVAKTKKAGIKVLGYFILGIPVETHEEELQTVEFAVELGIDYAQFGSLSPLPGTDLYDLAVKNGWYREGPGPAPEEYGQTRPLLITGHWTEARLKRIMSQAYRRFYFRPGYLLKTALRPRGFLDLARSGLRLLRWLFAQTGFDATNK